MLADSDGCRPLIPTQVVHPSGGNPAGRRPIPGQPTAQGQEPKQGSLSRVRRKMFDFDVSPPLPEVLRN